VYIQPLNNLHLVQMEDRNANRIIHLGSKRSISSARYGLCVRSDKYEGCRVLCSHGGLPYDTGKDLFFVPEGNFIRVDKVLQKPYIQIQPLESYQGGTILVPEIYFSGWYIVLETFPGAEVSRNQHVVPIYGQPRLEMEDDTEYIHQDGIGVVKC
jgi:hypothetical protein